MDGLEVVQKLRGMPEFTSMLIIVLTAHGNSERGAACELERDFLTAGELENLMETPNTGCATPVNS